MKKMLLATALALLITGCAQQTFTVQNKPAITVAPKETITIISSFLEFLGRRKLSLRKICGGAENVDKTKPANVHVNGLLGLYFGRNLLSAGSACVLLAANCMSCPSIWAALSALLINKHTGSFQLFLHGN